jgi:TfoX/Sxy family transcriptional regulator of competence genes
MAFDEQLAERTRAAFRKREVAFAEKRMMGGLCFLVADKMCVGVHQDRLMVRLDPDLYERALKRTGCVPMDFTGRPMRGFVFIQPAGLAGARELDYWLALALEFNPRAKSSRRRK